MRLELRLRLYLIWVSALFLVGLVLYILAPVAAKPHAGWQGTLTHDTTFFSIDNPHEIIADLIVPTGVRLTLAPGAELRFAPGASLFVYGHLYAVGTFTQPITLTRRDTDGYWGAVVILDSFAENKLAHTVVEYAGEESDTTPRYHGLTLRNGKLTVVHSVIRHIDSRGIHVEDNAIFSLLDSEIYHTRGDALSAARGQLVVQRNHIHDIAWQDQDYEGISINEMSPAHPALVTDNDIHHISDDCLDMNKASATLARNRLHHCGDKAISIGALLGQHPNDSLSYLTNNLLYSNTTGVAVKDGAVSHLMNNTLVDNAQGLTLYEAHVGQGGGRAFVTNTIVWGNVTAITHDVYSTLSVAFSDVQGGWPGPGNIDTLPAFWPASDYHLSQNSPCVDAGSISGAPREDLDGFARFVGAAPDIGAYEWPPLRLKVTSHDQALALSWTLAFTPSLANHYAISYTDGVLSSSWITTVSMRTQHYTMSSLINGTKYTVAVVLQDIANNVLLHSNIVVASPNRFEAYLPVLIRQLPPLKPTPVLYELALDPADWAWLDDHMTNRETVPATFTYDGFVYDVGVRYRGEVARWLPKKSWKVDFDSAQLFQGQRETNLNAEYPDKSLMREWLAYDLFARAGIIAPRANFARLNVNSDYQGLFTEVDQVDERFLSRMGLNSHGNLYKADYGALHLAVSPEAYAEEYVKKTNKQDSYADLIAFVEMLNTTPETALPAALADVMDIGAYLDGYTVQTLIGNFEWVEKNYYLYHDWLKDQWIVIPWDLDLSFGLNHTGTVLDSEISWDNPIDAGTESNPKQDGAWNKLTTVILDHADFRYAYCRRLQAMLNDEFAADIMLDRIEHAYALIKQYGEADPYKWSTNAEFNARPSELIAYVRQRRAWLQMQMSGYCPSTGPLPVFNEVMSVNAQTISDEAGEFDPWLELYNPGLVSFDVGGLKIQDESGNTWSFPDGVTIPPRDFVVVWGDGQPVQGTLHAGIRLKPMGGELTLLDNPVHGGDVIAHLAYGPLGADLSFGPRLDGGTDMLTFSPATPGWSNQGQPPVVADVAQYPVEPDAGQSVTVTATITDVDANLQDVWFTYQVFTKVVTISLSSLITTPSAVLPAQGDGAVITYTLNARDAVGMQTTVSRRYRVGFHRPPLYLNELLAINEDGLSDEFGEENDWLEIFNAGLTEIDLGGMYLTDALENSTKWQIPTGTLVPAGGYVIFWADEDLEQGAHHLNFKLAGDGERLALYAGPTGYNELIDEVYYPPQTVDRAWGRYPDGLGMWQPLSPTPGHANRQPPPTIQTVLREPHNPQAGVCVTVTAWITDDGLVDDVRLVYDAGTTWLSIPMSERVAGQYVATLPARPGGADMYYYLVAYDDLGEARYDPSNAPSVVYGYRVGQANTLFINELMAHNTRTLADEAGEFEDWFELYSSAVLTADLGGLYLSDDFMRPDKWQVPVGTFIVPEGYMLIWADDDMADGALHTNFKLDRMGESLGLFARRDAQFVLLDAVSFGPQAADFSYGRDLDGGAVWRIFSSPTPGISNQTWGTWRHDDFVTYRNEF